MKPWISEGCPWKRWETRWMTPGVSILEMSVVLSEVIFKKLEDKENALLVLEFLHDVEEMIVHIWLVLKLDLHSVEVAQGICHI